MDLWEKVLVVATIGLVMVVAIANAINLCFGKAGRGWLKRKSSSKNPPEDRQS